jgi:hypothetical protein
MWFIVVDTYSNVNGESAGRKVLEVPTFLSSSSSFYQTFMLQGRSVMFSLDEAVMSRPGTS